MKVPAMLMAELRRLSSSRMSIIALVALMCVPVIYGGLYLWANQDPYGKLDQVPVAIVNADEGATLDGESVDYGDRVADNLLEDGSFDWQRMDADGAAAALEHGDIDFSVTLPADFSAALVSAGGSDPHQATLQLQTNDANNYLASTIGGQAIERIRASVAKMVGEQAALQLLDGIAQIRSNLVTAADGAAQLASGAASAASGADQLASGSSTLADGTATLASGARQVSDGASQVASGAAQVASGTATLDGYADRAGTLSQTAADALPGIRTAIADELAAQGLDQAQIDAVLARLDPLGTDILSANATVQSAVAQVDRLADGAAQVSAGAAQVSSGASQVADGAAQVRDGAAALDSGIGQLADGSQQLSDGLAQGLAQIPDSDEALRQDQADVISDPVDVSTGTFAAAGDYGAGLAPFFAALAGWIGIYALFLIVKPVSRRAVTALHSPIRITLAGWLTPALLGGVQMLALFGVLALALGFTFANPLATLGIMVLASITYAAIILALNVWLGSVGQFLGLVLMVLQLVTAGGTFPWQTLPGPLAALHHVLPMGFVVDAMRQLMYGGDLGRVGGDVTVLLGWMLGALVIAALGVTRMTHRRTLRDLAPSLIG